MWHRLKVHTDKKKSCLHVTFGNAALRHSLSLIIFLKWIDYNIDDYREISFREQTDTILESSYGNMLAHKRIQLKAQN